MASLWYEIRGYEGKIKPELQGVYEQYPKLNRYFDLIKNTLKIVPV